MTPDDLPAARALWAAAEGVELAEGDEPAQLASFLQRNPGLSQVALIGDRLVGAVLAGHDGRRGWLYHLAVAAEARGARVGRGLVERALDGFRREGIVRALILVANDNEAGTAFWDRSGWERLDEAHARGTDL